MENAPVDKDARRRLQAKLRARLPWRTHARARAGGRRKPEAVPGPPASERAKAARSVQLVGSTQPIRTEPHDHSAFARVLVSGWMVIQRLTTRAFDFDRTVHGEPVNRKP